VEAPQWRRAEIRQRSPVRLTFRIRSCEHYFDFAFQPDLDQAVHFGD
jgi:hypothetical protein